MEVQGKCGGIWSILAIFRPYSSAVLVSGTHIPPAKFEQEHETGDRRSDSLSRMFLTRAFSPSYQARVSRRKRPPTPYDFFVENERMVRSGRAAIIAATSVNTITLSIGSEVSDCK